MKTTQLSVVSRSMKAHELAHLLRQGPDLPVVIYNNQTLEEVTEVSALASDETWLDIGYEEHASPAVLLI